MKQDLQTARRNLKSPNIKTRKRALKIIKQYRRQLKQFNYFKMQLILKILTIFYKQSYSTT